MSNENQKVTITEPIGFIEKLGGSFKGILFGLVLILAASYFLYWNEGRTVKEAGAIAEAELLTVDMPNIDTVDPAFNGKLVYATGLAKSNEVLVDPIFGVSATAIKISRSIQYYQWVEHSETTTTKTADGKEQNVTNYSYTKQWVNSPVSSDNFYNQTGHINNIILQAPAKDEQILSAKVSFGAYNLPKSIIASISNREALNVESNAQQIAKIESLLKGTAQTNSYGYQAYYNTTPVKKVHAQANAIYLGISEMNPEIGDMKITFFKTADTDISIVAQVNKNTFEPFLASNGENFMSVRSRIVNKQVIFQDAKDSNSTMAWIFRVLGILIAYIGFKLIFGPIALLSGYVPVLGSIVDIGVGLVSTLLAIAWSFIIIALAWIRFRPILAISLIAIAAVFIAFMIWRGHQKKEPAPVEAPAE